MRYLLVDVHNMMHRAKHSTSGDVFLKMGLALHISFNTVKQAWKMFEADHVVFCMDGRSWRKDVYPNYKANRKALAPKKSADQIEEEKLFFQMIDDFHKYVDEKTNASVLYHPQCEADDFIARFIQRNNKDNEFVILSTDTDFQQLIAHNVMLYDGVQNKLTRADGFFDDKGKPLKDSKGKVLSAPEPEWMLFEKCIRGDSSDNIMSAYPGARVKGTKDKVGIREAYEDRTAQGYSWNNFMMQRWEDHNGKEKKVKEQYEFNKMLIDLTQQPDHIKEILDSEIDKLYSREIIDNKTIGLGFLRFCGQYDLQKAAEELTSHTQYLKVHING